MDLKIRVIEDGLQTGFKFGRCPMSQLSMWMYFSLCVVSLITVLYIYLTPTKTEFRVQPAPAAPAATELKYKITKND